MPTPQTTAEIIQSRLTAILNLNLNALKVDTRNVKVINHLPDQAFSQRDLPLISVELPERQETSPWGMIYERRTYDCPFFFVTNMNPRPDQMPESMAFLEQLMDRTRNVFRQYKNLNMAFLHIYESDTRWQKDEFERLGNQLIRLPATMSVSLIIGKAETKSV